MFGFVGFSLGLIRISTFLLFIPLLNMRNVPFIAKIGLAGLLAFIVFPEVPPDADPANTWLWSMLVIQEVGIGLLLAFVVILVFGIIYFAGQLIDVPMGFGMVSIFDPATSMQLPVFSQFYHILGALVFFAVDGHLWLIRSLAQSYTVLPVGSFFELAATYETIMALGSNLFSMGLQIALPVMGTILLTDCALGIVTKTVPQINVFVIGFPIKILVGMFLLVFVLPFYVNTAAALFATDGLLFRYFHQLLQAAGGS